MNKITVDSILEYEERFSHFESSPIKSKGRVIAFHTNAMSKTNLPLGTGSSTDEKTSKLISISEMLERNLFHKFKLEKPAEFIIDQYPTTCGFAFGFHQQSVATRAICEAIERWAWSKWIDCKIPIIEIEETKLKLTPLANFYRSFFDEVRYFEQPIIMELGSDRNIFTLGIVLACKGEGIFAGSKVSLSREALWDHSFAESWRHLIISKSNLPSSIAVKRIKYFAVNKDKALNQLPHGTSEFPSPALKFFKSMRASKIGGFLVRAVCDDYIGWHVGAEDRFVY